MEKQLPLLFLGIFLVSCIVQGSLWANSYVLDDTMWKGVMKETAQHVFIHPQFDNLGYPYGYPAVPLLFVGGALIHADVSPDVALRLILVVLISLGIALVGVLAYRLRPRSWWWLGAVVLLMLDTMYYIATPPSSAVMPFVVALVLLTLLISETQEQKARLPLLVHLGVLGGFALSLRLDISLAIVGMSALYLLYYVRTQMWVLLLSGVASTIVFNPFLWAYPVEFFTAVVWRITTSYTSYEAAAPWNVIVALSPLAMLALCMLLIVLFIRPNLVPVARSFLYWLAGTTALISGILLASPVFHPEWYFSPLLLTWVAFLPLFVLALLPSLPLQKLYARLGESTVSLCAIGVLIAATVFFPDLF